MRQRGGECSGDWRQQYQYNDDCHNDNDDHRDHLAGLSLTDCLSRFPVPKRTGASRKAGHAGMPSAKVSRLYDAMKSNNISLKLCYLFPSLRLSLGQPFGHASVPQMHMHHKPMTVRSHAARSLLLSAQMMQMHHGLCMGRAFGKSIKKCVCLDVAPRRA